MPNQRPSLPSAIETELLLRSKRRCCLCFGWNADTGVKAGQIAHLDRDPSNNSLNNLAWLCLFHHDHYDSTHRQAKGIKLEEVKAYRAQLYSWLSEFASQNAFNENQQPSGVKSDGILDILDRYSSANETATKEIVGEMMTRIDQIHQFTLLDKEAIKSLEKQGIKDDRGEAHYIELEKLVRQKPELPEVLWELQNAGHLWPSWKEEVESSTKHWMSGLLSDEELEYMLAIFEEGYELDLHYLLFGLARQHLSPPQLRALWRFTCEHGQRESIRRLCTKQDEIPF
jgi:hypothetical protein